MRAVKGKTTLTGSPTTLPVFYLRLTHTHTKHAILGPWFRASYSKYAYEYPTRYNDNVLVLLQDLYMFRVPAVPIIRSTILQLTVTGITCITMDREVYGNVHFKSCASQLRS
jgi:hypothetical protein